MVFTIIECGQQPRCSLEVEDSSDVRIDKIASIISQCQYGVHDLSRTELDKTNALPRFNMPLELGLFLGDMKFGGKAHRLKNCLIMDKEEYRYNIFCSDISGQDIKIHNNKEEVLSKIVRNWLRSCPINRNSQLPSGSIIYNRYKHFNKDLPKICDELNLREEEFNFIDLTNVIIAWRKKNKLLKKPIQ